MKFNLRKDINSAIRVYPGLKLVETGNKLSLSGEIDLIHPAENKVIDTFSVDISFPDYFPYCFPVVIETSCKIERISDRHVFTKNNNLCFAVQAEERMRCRNGITTCWFIEKILLPRLAEEYLVNNGGEYVHEFSHGTQGVIEFYCKKLNIPPNNTVIDFLKKIREGHFPRRNDPCFCGSGKDFKKCHFRAFEELSCLGYDFITSEINMLESSFQVEKDKAK